MPRPAAPYLMEALARRSGAEDRLTEALACVLAFDAGFRDAFLDGIGLPGQAVRLVQTQVGTGVRACSMDMHFTLGSEGSDVAEVWFEHKIDQPFGETQLDDYEDALRSRKAAGAVVDFCVIARKQPKPPEREQLDRLDARVLSWNDVADVIASVLTQRDANWSRAAARVGASVELRILAELAVYLQEVATVAVTEPFGSPLVGALQNIDSARKVGEQLLTRVAEGLHPGCQDEPYPYENDEIWIDLWSTGWWNDVNGGRLYLWMAPRAWFAEDADPVPSFGIAVEVGEDDAARITGDEAFTAAVDAAGLRLGDYWKSGTFHVSTSTELAAIADLPNLGEQVKALCEFAVPAIKGLASCVPTGTDRNARPRGRDPSAVLDTSALE